MTAVLVEGLQNHPRLNGLIVDGVRVSDFSSFEKAHGTSIACILRLECSRGTMLTRLRGRAGREGDQRLGLADGHGADPTSRELFNAFQTVDRVDAFLERSLTDDDALHAHFGEAYSKVVHVINGELPIEDCTRMAAEAVQLTLASAVPAVGQESLEKGAAPALATIVLPALSSPHVDVDWSGMVERTSARLDRELHPDGRPRTTTQTAE